MSKRTVYISESQKKRLKKAIAAQDQVGGKVNAGVMGMVTGMVCEDSNETITLYHGVMANNLEFNIEHGGFVPRVCSEGGPKAIWLSEKQYGYQFIFKFDIPRSELSQMTNVDYIYEGVISFDEFNCELVKTDIGVYYDGFIVNVNLLDQNLLANQCRIFNNLPEKLSEMFAAFPGVYEKFVAPYLSNSESLMEETNYGVETWYRGYDPKYGVYGADTPYMLWLTDDLDYAKVYGGAVMEYQIDMDKCNGSVYDLPEDVDYFDGPSEELANELLAEGVNSYEFWANEDSSLCMCLWSTDPIVSQRQLPMDESVEAEKFELGFEPGGFEPNGHVISEGLERLNESPDKLELYNARYNEGGGVAFMSFHDNPDKFYMHTKLNKTHFDIKDELLTNGVYDKVYMADPDYIAYWGRYWYMYNVISFWENDYPAPRVISRVIDAIEEKYEQPVNRTRLLVELWHGSGFTNYVPYPWFFNGMYDMLKSLGIRRIIPMNDQRSMFRIELKDDRVFFSNINGDIKSQDEYFTNYSYGKLGESRILSEDREWCEEFDYKPYFKSLAKFLQDNGIDVNPLPLAVIHRTPQPGLYIKTGYYDPEAREVHVFVADRHPKDVLRSFTHEMIHHHQNITGTLGGYKGQTIKGDKELEKLESEAYLKGNIYFRRWTEELRPQVPGTVSGKKLNENIEKNFDIDELSTPDSIDLSSFDINDKLNPKFWRNGKLDLRVRDALLGIADDFYESLDVSWVEPEDIIMTGSLANYNWSKEYSDIDLHIIVDFSKVDRNVKLVKDYFDSKRRIWNDTHDNLTMFGYPVEVYVQDTNEPHEASGIFSLERDKWIKVPSPDNFEKKYDESTVKEKASDYMNQIDDLCDEYEDSVADCDLDELHQKACDLFDAIKMERRNGLKNGGGEYNTGNIIFKTLRRNGYIEKLAKLKVDTYDTMKSVLN